MRKLLCVTPLFPSREKPFYCIYLLQQLQALSKCGYDITVMVPTADGKSGAVKEEYEGLRVIRISYTSLSEDLKRQTDLELNGNKYDIIALNLCSPNIIKLFLGYRERLPVVLHFHGLNVWENYYEAHPVYAQFIKLIRILIFRKASAIIGVSKKVGLIAEKHYPADRIYTVYNGVKPEMFYPGERPQKSTFDIYCVANLIKIKGHEYLINGFAEAKEQLPETNLRLHIIGDGPLRDELAALSVSLGLENEISFEGEAQYDQIAEKFGRECDMFIMPSYFESLGCVYLEAMACGVPAVGVNGCGIDEVITDGKNGFLVAPKNSRQIAEKIIWAVHNKDKLRRIGEEGRKTVLDGYTWEHSGLKLAETYERIINRYERF